MEIEKIIILATLIILLVVSAFQALEISSLQNKVSGGTSSSNENPNNNYKTISPSYTGGARPSTPSMVGGC